MKPTARSQKQGQGSRGYWPRDSNESNSDDESDMEGNFQGRSPYYEPYHEPPDPNSSFSSLTQYHGLDVASLQNLPDHMDSIGITTQDLHNSSSSSSQAQYQEFGFTSLQNIPVHRESITSPNYPLNDSPDPRSSFSNQAHYQALASNRNVLNLRNQIIKWRGIGNKADKMNFNKVGKGNFLKLDKNVLLGSGSNGTRVYLGTFRQSVTNGEKLVAIKRIQYDTDAEYKATIREIENLQRLDHYNLIKYLQADNNDEFNLMFIGLELCKGSLINVFELRKDVFQRPFILRNKALPDDWWFKKHLLLGVANGLNYIHQQGHVHRDLKPQNILVQVDDSNEFGYKAVICDFELTREFKDGKTKLSVSSGIVGTHGWMAKEVLNKGDQTKALDVFAYGCIVQFVMSENRDKDMTHPFGPDIQRDSAIMEGKRYSYISTYIADNEGYVHPEADGRHYFCERNWVGYRYLGDALLADILVGVCISENINVRPSAAEIIKHPFYWSYEQRMQCNERMFNAFKDNFEKEDVISVMESNWKSLDNHPLSLLVPVAWDYYLMHRRKAPSVELSASIFNCLMRNIRNIQQHYVDAIKHFPDLKEVMDGNDESMGQYFFEGVPLSFPVIYIHFLWFQSQSNRLYKEKLDIYNLQIETLFAIKKDHCSL